MSDGYGAGSSANKRKSFLLGQPLSHTSRSNHRVAGKPALGNGRMDPWSQRGPEPCFPWPHNARTMILKLLIQKITHLLSSLRFRGRVHLEQTVFDFPVRTRGTVTPRHRTAR